MDIIAKFKNELRNADHIDQSNVAYLYFFPLVRRTLAR